jgi:hypothetical protein
MPQILCLQTGWLKRQIGPIGLKNETYTNQVWKIFGLLKISIITMDILLK